MTYNDYLLKLLQQSESKSADYLAEIHKGDMDNSDAADQLFTEWEDAEKIYRVTLDRYKSEGIMLSNKMPD